MDDLLLVGGRVITLVGEPGQALAVREGRVSFVGRDDEARRRPARETIDLGGRTVIPGFIDAHVHLVATGLDMEGPDVGGARSVKQVLARIAEYAGRLAPGEVLWCGGIDPSVIAERRLPTRDELDAVVPDRVVWVCHAEYHAGSANTRCLQYLGLDDRGAETDGVDREMISGRPTGWLSADANGLARRRVGELISGQRRRAALQAAAARAASKGITTVHAMEGGNLFGDGDVDLVLSHGSGLPVDVVLYWQTTDVARVRRVGLPRIGGCVPLDGSTGTHTGAMIEPYTDAPECRGTTYLSQTELDDWVMEAHASGMQVAMHVGGDRSAAMLLDAYENALKALPRKDHRHRIEHFEVPQPQDMARAARLGVALSMQPAFDYFWGSHDGDYHLTLGEERWARTNAVGSALRSGILVGGGSDSGVTPMDPLLGMHAALNHHRPGERVSADDALRLFTSNAARLAFQERDRGVLTVGCRADFAILSDDPLLVPAHEVKDIGVMATFRLGTPTYWAM